MRDLYRDLAPQRRSSDPSPVQDISVLFGAVACAFVFATAFCSLWMGVPTP